MRGLAISVGLALGLGAALARAGADAQTWDCASLLDPDARAARSTLFGYTVDTAPVSYPEISRGNRTGRVLGFCGRLFDHLSARDQALTPCEVRFDERFAVFGKMLQGHPAILCGAQSITPQRREALTAAASGFSAEISSKFLVTSTKLLVRSSQSQRLREQPEGLRIGLLKARPGLEPVTTEVIELTFPNARFVPLRNRTEAVQALTRPIEAEDAIDAYASDEVILADMLHRDLPSAAPDQRFDLQPPLYGYSHEEYVVVTYNAPGLIEDINAWLDSDAGRQAAADILPRRGVLLALLDWLSWRPYAALAWGLVIVMAVLLGSAPLWGARHLAVIRGRLGSAASLWWGRRRDARRRRSETSARGSSPRAAHPPSGADEAALADTATGTDEKAATRPLTTRELEVLREVVKNRSSKRVARHLGGISERTVETHIQSIFKKLGVKNRDELKQEAIKLKLVAPDEDGDRADIDPVADLAPDADAASGPALSAEAGGGSEQPSRLPVSDSQDPDQRRSDKDRGADHGAPAH